MSYCVDVISEDSFYENLVLGVTKLLESNPRVSNVLVERRWPAERSSLSSWEQKHSISLPDDLRQFYLSTDGFRLKWSYQYSMKIVDFVSPDGTRKNNEVLPVGAINVNPLAELNLTPQLKETLDKAAAATSSKSDKAPQIGPKWKVFELDECKGTGKVCLINSDNAWSIWLLENDGAWTWLADSFVRYFRMALVHQGLPRWQAVFTKKGLVPWAEQLFLLMAPHLLEDGETRKTRPPQVAISNGDAPLNHIDAAIFKAPGKQQQQQHHQNRAAANNSVKQ